MRSDLRYTDVSGFGKSMVIVDHSAEIYDVEVSFPPLGFGKVECACRSTVALCYISIS